DQQVAAVVVGRLQAEATERPAGLDRAADLEVFEQRRGGTAGDVADGDFHALAGAHRVVVDGGQRVAALGRGAVAVAEMHLHELPGNVVQRLAVVAGEHQVGHGGRQHAAGNE